MTRRRLALAALALLLVSVVSVESAQAERRYKYGRYRAKGAAEQGFFVQLEGALTNPRNSGIVVASSSSGTPLTPSWSDDPAGSLALGYEWSSGNRLWVDFRGFETDARTTAATTVVSPLHLAVGPPLAGATGSRALSVDMMTEISTQTIDAAWGHSHQLGQDFRLQWSLGLRYASFEETYDGTYGGVALGATSYRALKNTQSDMFGLRAAIEARYRFHESFFVSGGLGMSFLDGEIDAASSLTPAGAIAPDTLAVFTDDGRSGRITDLDVALGWNLSGDALRITVGWTQSVWDDLVTDLVREFPGSTAPLAERDSLTFSGYKLGLYYRF